MGLNAGKVWQTLSQKGGMNIESLKMETKLNLWELGLAIGWLMRENKVIFVDRGEAGIHVELRYRQTDIYY